MEYDVYGILAISPGEFWETLNTQTMFENHEGTSVRKSVEIFFWG